MQIYEGLLVVNRGICMPQMAENIARRAAELCGGASM